MFRSWFEGVKACQNISAGTLLDYDLKAEKQLVLYTQGLDRANSGGFARHVTWRLIVKFQH